MFTEIPRSIPFAISQRGLALAERRRSDLIILFQTGRWRHCFSEEELQARLDDAEREILRWRAMAVLAPVAAQAGAMPSAQPSAHASIP